ncbi:MAG: GNAT family N-acetyltransferase [Muribaculaceae bacterium]|nr:GNAT family N-acetyltransferase [Muribaculaceae bacterium]
MKLSNDLVELRAPEPDDLDLIYILENESLRSESSFATAPASRNQIWHYLESYDADIYSARQLRFIIVDRSSGQTAGTIDICDYEPRDRRAFVGISIAPGLRRRGLGRAALEVLCGYASETIGLHQLAAQVAVDNEASLRLFAGCGFRTCGKLRSWIRRGPHYTDVLLLQRLFV